MRNAEFGIIVRSDLKRCGLGQWRLDKTIRDAGLRGTRLLANVLRENHRMLALAADNGFEFPESPGAEPSEPSDTCGTALCFEPLCEWFLEPFSGPLTGTPALQRK